MTDDPYMVKLAKDICGVKQPTPYEQGYNAAMIDISRRIAKYLDVQHIEKHKIEKASGPLPQTRHLLDIAVIDGKLRMLEKLTTDVADLWLKKREGK